MAFFVSLNNSKKLLTMSNLLSNRISAVINTADETMALGHVNSLNMLFRG
jgi:hypothetical protein